MNDNKQIQPGEVTVVKLGGSIFEQRDTTITDVIRLQKQSVPLVLIHGGANMVTKWLNNNNNKTDFHQGERVTDQSALEMVTAVLGGLVNKEIVASINIGGGRAVGISGVDGGLIRARPLDDKLGFVGEVTEINPEVVHGLLNDEFIPVIATIGSDETGQAYNINADTVAGAIAESLEAEKLVYLTDVEGIYADPERPETLISRLRVDEAEALLREIKAKLEALKDMMALRDYVDEGPIGRRRLPTLREDERPEDEEQDELVDTAGCPTGIVSSRDIVNYLVAQFPETASK